MLIPQNLLLSAEEIQYIRLKQLEILTGFHASNFSRWEHGGAVSERSLERIAATLYTSKDEVLRAIELRREAVRVARVAQSKADQLIGYIQQTQKLA